MGLIYLEIVLTLFLKTKAGIVEIYTPNQKSAELKTLRDTDKILSEILLFDFSVFVSVHVSMRIGKQENAVLVLEVSTESGNHIDRHDYSGDC